MESYMSFIKRSFTVLLLTFSCATYASAHLSQQEKLEKTRYFSIGMNGFVGKISDGEKIYREIIKDSKAEKTFINIFKGENSTNEAKLYAACGLYALNSKELDSLPHENNNEYVTLLQGDILYKKRFNDVIKSIKSNGCE
ncbi:MchS3 family protein [Pantoea sp. Z09]|uniref:MchS3 family protein n=1 Tax=Pantoea sp. Z09 TaxID=2886821 RepID=UPI001EFE70FF|nr:MchS3 family protein [Pantoea sp. Z09]